MAKKALGKGLDALITDGVESTLPGVRVLSIDVDDIEPNRHQPRKSFDEEGIEELARSIKDNGLLQPVVVMRKGERYELIVGERRVRAARKAGLKEIPAMVKDQSEGKLLELALIENVQREDLNPVEEATAYRMILERDLVTQEELAGRLGKSRSYIANMVRILDLPRDVQEHVSRGTLSVGQAKAILSLDTEGERLALAWKILNEGLTVRQTEEIVKKKNVPRGTITPKKDPSIAELEDKLRDRLGTKVTVNYRSGRGTIRIEFYTDDDLERIVEALG
jgi:ParB family transcriptional regulator, chromosome partitioning protein